MGDYRKRGRGACMICQSLVIIPAAAAAAAAAAATAVMVAEAAFSLV